MKRAQRAAVADFIETLDVSIREKISLLEIEKCCTETTDKRLVKNYLSSVIGLEHVHANFCNFLCFKNNNKFKITDYLYNEKLVSLKFNISEDEAAAKVKEIKSNKATSKIKFIERHGEEEGLKKFEQFQKSSKQSSEQIEAQGKEKRELFYRKNSIRCFEYYLERGLASTYEDAVKLANEFQKKNSGVNIEYYLENGFSIDEAENILHKINEKKGYSYKKIKEKYPYTWRMVIELRLSKYRQTIGAIEETIEFNAYKAEVLKITKINVVVHGDKIENLNKRSRDYHLDHLFSVKQGYLNGIDPEVIGHWTNLKIIPGPKNCSKRSSCSVSINELFEKYHEHKDLT